MIRRPPRSTLFPYRRSSDLLIHGRPKGFAHFRRHHAGATLFLAFQDRPGIHHHPRALRKRSEEHTSELQSPCNLVCRLLLEKKKKNIEIHILFSAYSTTVVQ